MRKLDKEIQLCQMAEVCTCLFFLASIQLSNMITKLLLIKNEKSSKINDNFEV